MLNYKALAFEKLYQQTQNIRDLRTAFEHYERDVDYWELILQDYKTFETYNVLGIYNYLPFEHSAKVSYKLFELTGNKIYKEKILLKASVYIITIDKTKTSLKNFISELNKYKPDYILY